MLRLEWIRVRARVDSMQYYSIRARVGSIDCIAAAGWVRAMMMMCVEPSLLARGMVLSSALSVTLTLTLTLDGSGMVLSSALALIVPPSGSLPMHALAKPR